MRSGRKDEGTPHPALRATFPSRGRQYAAHGGRGAQAIPRAGPTPARRTSGRKRDPGAGPARHYRKPRHRLSTPARTSSAPWHPPAAFVVFPPQGRGSSLLSRPCSRPAKGAPSDVVHLSHGRRQRSDAPIYRFLYSVSGEGRAHRAFIISPAVIPPDFF